MDENRKVDIKTRKCLVICGPTASGKSGLSDAVAKESSAFVVLVDSMQVYREIPEITNQSRSRPARLSGVVSIEEEWSVARQRDAVLKEIDGSGDERFVLDAGTGMYLNSILLDFPLAPKVAPEVRERAERAASGSENPRRTVRQIELMEAGEEKRGSVWDGDLRFETYVIYLRPDRPVLDLRIQKRTERLVERGLEEAENLLEAIESGVSPTPSVSNAIGVKEMLLYASGEISAHEARERISGRTRRLARRQMRWFDKLLTSLTDRIDSVTLDNTRQDEMTNPDEILKKHTIHDILCRWKD